MAIDPLAVDRHAVTVEVRGNLLAVPMIGTVVGGGRCHGTPDLAARMVAEVKSRGERWIVRKGVLRPPAHEYRAVAAPEPGP